MAFHNKVWNNSTEFEGVSKLPDSLKNHKALTFTSQGFAMSKSCCNFRP